MKEFFQRLDSFGYSLTFIKWIFPQGNETIENNVIRIYNQITSRL
jgi:hypothetical protein